MANAGEFDVLHMYTNEEDTALPFAELCRVPVVFTHHDPFNFLVKYKNVFPKYTHLNWVSMSLAQRVGMPIDTNWVANIYHGVAADRFVPLTDPRGDYFAFMGRIIQPKGLHLAIAAAKKAGVALKIAGKHYAGQKDSYWRDHILPELGSDIEYVGFITGDAAKQDFLGNATALVVPSLFDEPFGMVTIEALACGTPVIGLESGATPELITNGENGLLVKKADEPAMVANIALAMRDAGKLSRGAARKSFEARFTLDRMCQEHYGLYCSLA
jgi:glycosyltransferase involved in cell wall biosynthesis